MSHDHSEITKGVMIATSVACVFCFFVVFIVFLSRENDTTLVSASCIAVSGIITIMPWQLAPLIADRHSKDFSELVAYGINMCHGTLCFVAATVLKYGYFTRAASVGTNDDLAGIAYWLSVAFFILATLSTLKGFYQFIEHTSHHVYPKGKKVDNRSYAKKENSDV